MKVTRRTFLYLSAVGLAGCSPGRDRLRIFVYAGNHERIMREVFVPLFEAATGQTCVLESGWWDALAKLKSSPAGRPAFDLMITDATQGYPAIREGLFARLDEANLPNVRLLAPSALDNAVWRDRMGVPYPDSVMTLAYRPQEVEPAPTTWGDLLRESLRGKISLYSSFYMSLYTFACMRAAQEGKPGSAQALIENDLPGMLDYARRERLRVKFWWKTSAEMILDLGRGTAAACNMHSPEMIQALREDRSLAAVVPQADRAMVQVMWCIPADSPRKKLAEAAINILFSEEVQYGFAKRGSATALPRVAAELAAADPLWASIYPHTPEQLAQLQYYPYEKYAKNWDAISDEWERRVLRAG
ncbi:MAG: extracellular solute-binding protein [Gemmataceae bacterium]